MMIIGSFLVFSVIALLLLSLLSAVGALSQRLDEENAMFTKLKVPQNLSCDRPWPKISLFLPVNVKPYLNPYRHANTRDEWKDIFISSLIVFWPIKLSQTRIVFMIDAEANITDVDTFKMSLTSSLSKATIPPVYKIVSNNFTSDMYGSLGGMRQQLTGFFADLHVDNDTEYIGYVDGDSYFTTYVDREDLFEDGRPIVRPRFGSSWGNWYLRSAEWLLGGIPEPAKCMSYFPVMIKKTHIRDMREYIEKIHGKPMHYVFADWLGKFSNMMLAHFDPMCTFIWNFHRDEYSWHGYDTVLQETQFFSAGKQLIESNFTHAMIMPRPHICNHLVYHENLGSLEELFFRGICHGPPFPKADLHFEKWCQSFTGNSDGIDRGFVMYMHQFEHRNSDIENKQEFLWAYDKYRTQRLLKCSHNYSYEIMNFSAIKTHIKDFNYREAIPSLPYKLTT